MRQQSKQIASKIREDYRKEEQRQIDHINRIKKDELIKWREKQLGILELDYKKHLDEIGSAHIAAVVENAKQKQFEEQKEKNRRLALKRGKIAAQKLKDEKMKPTKEVKRVNQVKPVKPEKKVTILKAIESSPETSSSSTSSSSSSPSSSESSVIIVEKKKKPEINVKITASKQPAISPKKATATKSKSPVQNREYNPQRFASTNNSISTDVSLSDSPICDRPPFITKVSDMLDTKQAPKPIIRSSPHIAKTYKLDKSPILTRTTPKKTPQKQSINTVSSRLSRAIQAPSKTSGKSPMKVLPERKHFVPEFVKSQTTSTITRNDSINPQRRSRVQFYDHSNKFAREYCGNIDLEETAENVVPLNAWEEAKRDVALDEVKRNELLCMK